MEFAFEVIQCHCECGCKRIDQDYICEVCKTGLCKQNVFENKHNVFPMK